MFGFTFTTAPISVFVGASVQATKRYRPQIWVGWCLTTIGIGLLSMVKADTSRPASIGYQIITGTGLGAIYTSVYFPVLAPLPVTSNAYALSFFVFLRTLAQVRYKSLLSLITSSDKNLFLRLGVLQLGERSFKMASATISLALPTSPESRLISHIQLSQPSHHYPPPSRLKSARLSLPLLLLSGECLSHSLEWVSWLVW